MSRKLLAIAFSVLCFSVGTLAYEADLHYIDSILDLTRACRPQGVKLSAPSIPNLSEPDYQGTPSYGAIPLNGDAFPLVLDQGAKESVLYVDTDRSSVLRKVDWERQLWDGSLLASVPFSVSYEDLNYPSTYRIFLIWNPLTPTVLTYCHDSYRSGEIQLGGATYLIALIDDNTDGRYDDLDRDIMFIDTDQDGELFTTADSHEWYWLDEPFNIDGTVYQASSVNPDGSRIAIEETDDWVAEKPPLEVDFPAPGFTGLDISGKEISLASLKGQIVLLDFWASWCAPCLEELPTMKGIADEYAKDGVVVIGIDLDRSEESFTQAVANYDLSYRQIYDGPDGPISDLYRISGIPMLYLIDQEGIIRGKDLRGEELRQAVQALLRGEN
jgi:thiol-disulfide isomerase/thioredoxin